MPALITEWTQCPVEFPHSPSECSCQIHSRVGGLCQLPGCSCGCCWERGSGHPPTPSPLGCWLHSHTPAQWFSVLRFLMSALAQISVEQAKPFSHLLMRSFLHLNNPALRKLLWTASLQALCCAPLFLLLHLIRLTKGSGYRRCVKVLQLCSAERSAPGSPKHMAQQTRCSWPRD